MEHDERRIPLAIKVTHTAFVVVLVPAYARQYGPGNFLWFSDVALLVSLPALWLESPMLAGTQAVGVLVLESAWIVDFTAGLVMGTYPLDLASYMSDPTIPRSIRALSLFHLWLAPLLVFIVARTGYDRRAFRYQTVITWAILVLSWRLTAPEDNVNWVYSWPDRIQSPAGRAGFVLLLMAAIPLVCQLPAHLLLKRLFGPAKR